MLNIQTPTKRSLSEQRSFSISINYAKLSFYFLISSVTILILVQIQAVRLFLPFSVSSSSCQLPSWNPHKPAVFVPLKDLRFRDTPMDGNTWFMSTVNDTYEPGETEHLFFPSQSSSSDNKLLCILGNDSRNGTRNHYTLVEPHSLPPDAKLLPGLTFISDTYYDYTNLWHGLTAVTPFVAWYGKKGCVKPARWVLYHWGELRKGMSPWVSHVVESVFGRDTNIEKFMEGESRASCFEQAVVFRHNEGTMSRDRKEEVYGMIRCKARAYCNVSDEDGKDVRLTLLLRTGTRSFKNESSLIQIFDKECKKVDRCRMKVTRPNNLTFCDQVRLMSSTDVLVSSHGAQMTNMFLMDKNSSVMEFFPKGWHELAGVGQYVFQWIAGWAGLRHKGTWYDPNGEKCPFGEKSPDCFKFYKNGQIGIDEEYIGKWAGDVLKEMRDYKNSDESRRNRQQSLNSCPCT